MASPSGGSLRLLRRGRRRLRVVTKVQEAEARMRSLGHLEVGARPLEGHLHPLSMARDPFVRSASGGVR